MKTGSSGVTPHRSCSRYCTADTTKTQRSCHGNDHVEERSRYSQEHDCNTAGEQTENTDRDCASNAFPGKNAKKQAVEQISENDKALKRIVNLLPLLCGKIPFPGVIRKCQDSELQEHKSSKQAGHVQSFLSDKYLLQPYGHTAIISLLSSRNASNVSNGWTSTVHPQHL